MNRRDLALDSGLAGLVFATTVGMLAVRGFGVPSADARGLDVLGVVLTAASALPLAFRRLGPLTVFVVTGAATVALVRLGYPLDVPFGPLVAVYALAVTYSGHPRSARRGAAFLIANAFIPAIAVAYAARGAPLREIALPLVAWAMVFVGVWIAGDRARLRQERIIELEERAQRAEREAERERRLAAAQERTRIARELHDSAGHAINVILVQAGAARLLHEQDPAASRQAITTIEDVARDTIGEIDRLVRVLREDDRDEPPPADPTALGELVDRHRASGLRIATDMCGPTTGLPRSVAWAAYRILQEALTNAARHGCGSADLSVRYGRSEVEITVTNPTATDPPSVSLSGLTGGHGIVGMRERATLLGGTLQAALEPGRFRLHARLPLSEAAP